MFGIILPAVALVIGITGLIYLKKGPVFLPIRKQDLTEMVKSLDIKPGDRAVDLGSGDGRIVIEMAKAGAEAHGYEYNPLLVWWSRLKIKKAGLSSKAFIHRADFWRRDLSEFSVITVFGINYIMGRLEKKIAKEALPGLRIASYIFSFPTLKIFKKEHGVYFYKV